MNNLKEIQQIKLLIAKGKKNGFLTFRGSGQNAAHGDEHA